MKKVSLALSAGTKSITRLPDTNQQANPNGDIYITLRSFYRPALFKTMADSTNRASSNRSKRQALRFSAVQHPISYKTEFEDGKGVIDNVSSGGCAISDLSIPLNIQEKVLIILKLEGEENTFEIGARVLRVEKGHAALQFTDIDDHISEQLVKFFARRQRASLSG